MSDLIDRQAAIDACGDWYVEEGPEEGFIGTVKQLLVRFPSVQLGPIAAYWKKDVFGTVICSNCGGIRRDNRVGHTRWCNGCGCFMQGEQNE